MSEGKLVVAAAVCGLLIVCATCHEAEAQEPLGRVTSQAPAYFCTDPLDAKSCGPLEEDLPVYHEVPVSGQSEHVCVVAYVAGKRLVVAGCGAGGKASFVVYALCDIPQSRVAIFSYQGKSFSLVCAVPARGEVSL